MSYMNEELAQRLKRENDALKKERSDIDNLNQDIANYIHPRKNQITQTETKGASSPEETLYDTVAVRDAQILASGQMDYLVGGRWVELVPPSRLGSDANNDEARQWCGKCTEIMLAELDASNFYLELHEMLLDRSTFTHANMFCGYVETQDRRNGEAALYFRNDDVGTYSIAENKRGIVDKVFREYELTPRQAIQEFGEENVSEKVREMAKEPSKMDTEKTKYLHAIYPRRDSEMDSKKLDPKYYPIASCDVDLSACKIVRESGFPEMPYVVTRFLKWGSSPYGYTPSIEALPAVRQVNLMMKHMAALGEIQAWPRVLIPSGMVGQVNLSPGGQTIVDPNQPADAGPREWGTGGRWDIGKDMIEMIHKQIHDAYFVDMFQLLANLPNDRMTAFEVQARLAEKMRNFSPTFSRLLHEVFRPMLFRVFSVLFREGAFPQPPQSMMVISPDGKTASPVIPDINLMGKMALAVRDTENNAFLRITEMLSGPLQVVPGIADNFDMDEAVRNYARNTGLYSKALRPVEDRDEMRAAAAQQAQQQQALMAAESATKSAKNLAGADEDVKAAAKAQMGMAG